MPLTDPHLTISVPEGMQLYGWSCGVLCQDWAGFDVDPESVGSGPAGKLISKPCAVFTESKANHYHSKL